MDNWCKLLEIPGRAGYILLGQQQEPSSCKASGNASLEQIRSLLIWAHSIHYTTTANALGGKYYSTPVGLGFKVRS